MTLSEEILTLKKECGAVILAHNYCSDEVQDVADFVGDSLQLSIKARDVAAPVIVFCGVRFMAETAKILSPGSTVLHPVPDAGCPMAEMATAEAVREFRAAHPDHILVAYVNSTAETKAEVDICVTSANAERIVASLPADRPVLFLPDRNLGANVAKNLGRAIDLWPGYCPIHDRITVESVQAAKATHPNALFLCHPECRPEVVALADHALSTGGMLRFIAAYLLFDGMFILYGNAIKGAGDTRFAMIMGAGMAWCLFALPCIGAYALGASVWVLWYICVGYIMISGLVFYLRYRTGKWKTMRVIEAASGKGEGADGTAEGIQLLDHPAFSVQYHPEAAPGPTDAHYLFTAFARLMDGEPDYLNIDISKDRLAGWKFGGEVTNA